MTETTALFMETTTSAKETAAGISGGGSGSAPNQRGKEESLLFAQGKELFRIHGLVIVGASPYKITLDINLIPPKINR